MSDVFAPEVLADPIGLMVGLIEAREPGLDRAIITDIVERVAGGRAKRRRIAQALLDRPGVLDDGRSPAPRALGDLLIALNKAGARHIFAASMRRVRQAAAHHGAPRRALVLQCLRAPPRVVRGLRSAAASQVP